MDAERNESLKKFSRLKNRTNGKTASKSLAKDHRLDQLKNLPTNLPILTTSIPIDVALVTKDPKPEDREHVQLFEKIYNLFSMYAKFMGIVVKYDWIPHKHFMFWVVMSMLALMWLFMFYTQYIYVRSGEIMRIFEVFALYGIAVSVNEVKFFFAGRRYRKNGKATRL